MRSVETRVVLFDTHVLHRELGHESSGGYEWDDIVSAVTAMSHWWRCCDGWIVSNRIENEAITNHFGHFFRTILLEPVLAFPKEKQVFRFNISNAEIARFRNRYSWSENIDGDEHLVLAAARLLDRATVTIVTDDGPVQSAKADIMKAFRGIDLKRVEEYSDFCNDRAAKSKRAAPFHARTWKADY